MDFDFKDAPIRSIRLQVKPHLLYKPNLNDITVLPDGTATFELFDRVVIARDGYSVPLGTRGTIISVQPLIDTNPVRQENINAVEYFYDVLFDTSFEGAQSIADIAEKRLFKVRQSVLLNISHGLGKLLAPPPPHPFFALEQFYSCAVHFTDQNRKVQNNNKRIPQHAQSPIQQPTQNWRIQKNNGNNGGGRVENKEWPSLFNGHTNDRRNNRDAEKANNMNHQQTNPTTSRNKYDEPPKREASRRYGFKQSVQNTPQIVDGTANDVERNLKWRDEQKPKTSESSLKNIPLPRQFMELSLLEKQTKANLEAASNSGQLKDPSIILQSPSGNSPKEAIGDSSEVLRKLLRISSPQSSSPSTDQRPNDYPLNKLMPANTSAPFPNQIPAKMLPKPPSDWTGTKGQKQNVHIPNNPPTFPMHPPMRMAMPFMNNAANGFSFGPPPPFMPPPPRPFMFNAPMNLPHHPGMMRQYIGMGPQIAANFNAFPNQMVVPQPSTPMQNIKQGPIGPQNLSNNSKHLPGHGAFIPLQAIRKNAKPTKSTNATDKSNPVKPKKQPPLTEQEIHEQIDQFKRQLNEESAKDEVATQQSQPQKKSANKGPSKPKAVNGSGEVPRPKRLACKFDLPPA